MVAKALVDGARARERGREREKVADERTSRGTVTEWAVDSSVLSLMVTRSLMLWSLRLRE